VRTRHKTTHAQQEKINGGASCFSFTKVRLFFCWSKIARLLLIIVVDWLIAHSLFANPTMREESLLADLRAPAVGRVMQPERPTQVLRVLFIQILERRTQNN